MVSNLVWIWLWVRIPYPPNFSISIAINHHMKILCIGFLLFILRPGITTYFLPPLRGGAKNDSKLFGHHGWPKGENHSTVFNMAKLSYILLLLWGSNFFLKKQSKFALLELFSNKVKMTYK